jgi:hypothetical protein
MTKSEKMKKNIIVAAMAFLAGLGTMALAGCATYGVGVSTMTMEREKPEDTGATVKQELNGISLFASGEYYETSMGVISGMIERASREEVSGTGFNFFLKYPIYLLKDRLTLFPLLGGEYRWFASGGKQDVIDLVIPNFKAGGGLDFSFSKQFFLRGSATYTPGLFNEMKGWTFNAGIGFRTQDDKVRKRYKTGAEMREEAKAREKEAIRKGDEAAYQKAVAREPDNPEPYYDRGWYYYFYKDHSLEDLIAAAEEWKLALEKDPGYAIEKGATFNAALIAKYGLTNLKTPLDLSDVHLVFLIGLAYIDTVTLNKAPEARHDGYLEKALSYFQEGYDRDIAGGQHNTKDAKTAYLVNIGCARSLLADFDGAIAAYRELANAKDVDYDKSGITARIRELEGKKRTVAAYNALAAKGMYYVSASGSDDNDGLSEETAFKTFSKARSATFWNSEIKAITVIGALNQDSEGGDDDDEVFSIFSYHRDVSILITGIPHASAARRAVLSAKGADKNCVSASTGKFRFEYIEISGSPKTGLTVGVDGEVTLGEGARITGNNDRGAVVYGIKEEFRGGLREPGHLILDGGTIDYNKSSTNGAGVAVVGMFTMKRGRIANNTSTGKNYGGGGVVINSDDPVSIGGGIISGNKADYGAGVYVGKGTLTMSGGSISYNGARAGTGGVWVGSAASFILNGGTIDYNKSSENGAGVVVFGMFTMKRGNIRNNTVTGGAHLGGGVFISSDKPVSIEGGDISGNKADGGAGVYISEGTLTMSGGSISNNTAQRAGGVWVEKGASFIQQGGSVSGNTASQDANIYRE